MRSINGLGFRGPIVANTWEKTMGYDMEAGFM